MSEGERDSTGEWLLPETERPLTLAQLEQRIDYAVAVAQASEAAALEIGASAIDAAEQARRAAELAERASRGLLAGDGAAGGEAVGPTAAAQPPRMPSERPPAAATEYDRFRSFLERADRVSERLQAIAPGS